MTKEIDNPHQTALLLIDLINDFQFEGASAMLEQLMPATSSIVGLANQARALSIPVIYVNDKQIFCYGGQILPV